MCERTKDDFVSVYKKTYIRKYGFRPEPIHQENKDYKDVLSGPYTEYVLPNTHVSLEQPFEQMQHYYEKVIKSHPKIKKHLNKLPDEAVIAADFANRGRTVYQVDYCNIEDGFESAKSRARRRVSLPPDWGEIPCTTQQASFRPPTKIASFNLHVPPVEPPKSALQPNPKERDILKVTTGLSEYEAKIGVLGDLIQKDRLHGEHQENLECLKYQQMLQDFRVDVTSK
ncbi:uncharacterized protein LOC128991162 [Macrosteles quadrilineatus]|uniref:uncharacterized protein LOC128991162 n=1 Tax=Macrosteles quadrilineatus TaxID=74068 RepID=UPI0023E1B0CD|nr:uncharacterized protein LOC128991162 [Macrosteles quadrilineatus]